METYVLKNQESFNLEHIFECGQCFRWNKENDGSYKGIVKNSVIRVNKINEEIIFTGVCKDEDFKSLIRYYFDLDTNYSEYKEKLSKIDEYMKQSIKFGEGITRPMGMHNFIYNIR